MKVFIAGRFGGKLSGSILVTDRIHPGVETKTQICQIDDLTSVSTRLRGGWVIRHQSFADIDHLPQGVKGL